jgi:hypothetical protein
MIPNRRSMMRFASRIALFAVVLASGAALADYKARSIEVVSAWSGAAYVVEAVF